MIKVVWLCSFSDKKLRKNISFPYWHPGNIIRRLFHQKNDNDFAVWVTNAITEIEKIDEVEFHVICAHGGIGRTQEFIEKGIHYHVVWSEYDVIMEKIKRYFNKRNISSFPTFRKEINKIIKKIEPDLVHVIGIENKFHSMAMLDLSPDIPVIAQLQTLVNDERFKENCSISESSYTYDSEIECKLIQRANFIGTCVERFRAIILKDIKPNAVFVDTTLALTEPVNLRCTTKEFDFVYFAANIDKAADWAIESFRIAHEKHPKIKLDIVGGYTPEYKSALDRIINQYGLNDFITFEGKLPSHEDVLEQIRKSRFAIIPLKIDIVSGTIREAMANGIPVVTSETPGTPILNKDYECVLISPAGDHQAMAENMCKLLEDEKYAEMLKNNAAKLADERESNHSIILKWISVYKECLNNKQ